MASRATRTSIRWQSNHLPRYARQPTGTPQVRGHHAKPRASLSAQVQQSRTANPQVVGATESIKAKSWPKSSRASAYVQALLSCFEPGHETLSHAAMRCGIELLADKILGEPDGQ